MTNYLNFAIVHDNLQLFGASHMTTKDNPQNLETSLAEISTLVEKMEHGELTLEQSLEQFERGIHLIKHCQKILTEAEQKVQILMQNNTQPEKLAPYEVPKE